MKLLCFAVYDVKAEMFSTPIFVKAKIDAIRSFTDAANDKANAVGKYPGDFKLVQLGLFDDASGIFESSVNTIGFASEFVQFSELKAVK